ncbi:MAG: hypothetical protein IPL96_10990 [Holophagaceae bacterium]|nr:hypothetical protein [Holophagaceae bacterium]
MDVRTHMFGSTSVPPPEPHGPPQSLALRQRSRATLGAWTRRPTLPRFPVPLSPALALLFATALAAQPAPVLRPSPLDPVNKPAAVPLLVLGSFHMENPGQDAHNFEVKDILGPRKQKELAELLDRLEAYRPTKILIEAAYKGSPSPANYQKYLAGQFTLTPNEIHQVAFALARRLGHKTVYPVDYAMWMDGRVPAEIGEAKARPAAPGPQPAAATPAPAPLPERLQTLARTLDQGTVLDGLRLVNSPDFIREDHATYIEGLPPDPYSTELYGTTDPVTNWYKRNLRIFTNVYRVAEPGDRLLLLIGSGHLAILNRLAIDSRDFVLMDTLPYLR